MNFGRDKVERACYNTSQGQILHITRQSILSPRGFSSLVRLIELVEEELNERGGEELVKEDLLGRIEERRRVTKNNWRAALYEGLLESREFFEKYLMS